MYKYKYIYIHISKKIKIESIKKNMLSEFYVQ